MFLLTDRISLYQPAFKFGVNICHCQQSKMMDMIARRDRLDFSKTRLFKSAGKNDMTIDPIRTSGQLGKGHSNLKGYACFFGQNSDRAAATDCLKNCVVDFAYLLRFTFEMMFQIVFSAEVRLV